MDCWWCCCTSIPHFSFLREREIRKSADDFFFYFSAQTFIRDEVQAAASSSPSHKSDVTRDVTAKEERERGRRTTRRERKESLEGGYQGGVADGVDVKDFAAMKLGVEGMVVEDGVRGEGEDDGEDDEEDDGEDDGEGETCGGEGKVTDYSGEVGGTQRS